MTELGIEFLPPSSIVFDSARVFLHSTVASEKIVYKSVLVNLLGLEKDMKKK